MSHSVGAYRGVKEFRHFRGPIPPVCIAPLLPVSPSFSSKPVAISPAHRPPTTAAADADHPSANRALRYAPTAGARYKSGSGVVVRVPGLMRSTPLPLALCFAACRPFAAFIWQRFEQYRFWARVSSKPTPHSAQRPGMPFAAPQRRDQTCSGTGGGGQALRSVPTPRRHWEPATRTRPARPVGVPEGGMEKTTRGSIRRPWQGLCVRRTPASRRDHKKAGSIGRPKWREITSISAAAGVRRRRPSTTQCSRSARSPWRARACRTGGRRSRDGPRCRRARRPPPARPGCITWMISFALPCRPQRSAARRSSSLCRSPAIQVTAQSGASLRGIASPG